jgi:hypothetical protein
MKNIKTFEQLNNEADIYSKITQHLFQTINKNDKQKSSIKKYIDDDFNFLNDLIDEEEFIESCIDKFGHLVQDENLIKEIAKKVLNDQ